MAWMRSDLSLKIASLVLAVFVWMYVRTEAKPLQIFSVPLELQGLPDDVALAGDVLDSVAVRVRAPDTTLRSLTPGRFRARITLVGARPGNLSIPLTKEIVSAPLGVEVVRVDPPTLSLRVERRVTREVPVVARITGEPSPGFEYDGYTLSPDRVTVRGPEGVTMQVREVVAEEVTMEGRAESFEVVVGIVPDHNGARVVGDGTVQLRVNITPQRVTQVYTGIPLEPNDLGEFDYRLSYQPDSVTVVLEGTRANLASITAENIRVVLDLEGMGPREAPYSVKPRVVITPGHLGTLVAIHSVSEPTVNVKISR